jgi:hypothetical protein
MNSAGTSGTWETASSSGEGRISDLVLDDSSDLGERAQRVSFLEERIDLMLSCYVDRINNNIKLFHSYDLLTGDVSLRREFLNPQQLLEGVRWLKSKYDPIRSKLIDGEIPWDPDFELIFVTSRTLYNDSGDFLLESLFDRSNNATNDDVLDEMGAVLETMYQGIKTIRFGGIIKDYMYEFLALLDVDPREEDSVGNIPPIRYVDTVERYELQLIDEFERWKPIRDRLKTKHEMEVTVLPPYKH